LGRLVASATGLFTPDSPDAGGRIKCSIQGGNKKGGFMIGFDVPKKYGTYSL